jgi:hypothetical protein
MSVLSGYQFSGISQEDRESQQAEHDQQWRDASGSGIMTGRSRLRLIAEQDRDWAELRKRDSVNPKRKPIDALVRGTKGPVAVNQHADIFYDRRTRRERDRAAQTRKAIERSSDGE